MVFVQPFSSRDDLLLHRHRNPEILEVADRIAIEPRRRHANNRKRIITQTNGLSDYQRVLAQFISPETVTHHHHGMGIRGIVIVRGEHAAIERVDAQHGKVIAADQYASGVTGYFARASARTHANPVDFAGGEHAIKYLAVDSQILVKRIGK